MQTYRIAAGRTSQIIKVQIYDSSSTTGAKLTGLVYNSSGLTGYYNRQGVSGATAITLATATQGTFTSGGFIVVDGTNMPGEYELHVPDAALAGGVSYVTIHLKGATNMVPVDILIILANEDAMAVGTLSAIATTYVDLPSGHGLANSGSYIIKLTGGTNAYGKSRICYYSGTANRYTVSPDWNATIAGQAETTPSGTITFEVLPLPAPSTTYPVAANVTQIGGDAQSATDLKDFADAGYDPAANKVQGVVLTDTVTNYTGNTVQTGDAFARLGAPAGASVSADVAAVKSDTAAVLVDTASIGVTKNATFSNLTFLMVDATDFNTPETGLTVSGTVSLDGGAFGAIAGSIAEIGAGIYQADLLAADTNADICTYRFTAAGAADRFITIKTRA